ncbi:hypothetical protein LCGC14_2099470 [marine sediment metagenome]|uniref:Uncharacterized protein n=1 Tax=marine sediment metagenome TaxID=412755 RepID=A0A0F9H6S9_9ZZZZ
MGRRTKYPWELMRTAYVSGRCDTYLEVATAFGVNVKRVEERAAPHREGWFRLRVAQDDNVLDSALASLKEEDVDKLARLFKNRTDISLAVMKRASDELEKKESIATADIPSFLLAAARLSDPIIRAAESSGKNNTDKQKANPLHIHAPNATVVSVQQMLAFIGKKRGVKGIVEES